MRHDLRNGTQFVPELLREPVVDRRMSASKEQRWPERLWLVRHGQSAGNVARDAAYAAGNARIEIGERDVDVPLSELGVRQAEALGRWFSKLDAAERPQAVMTSPYLRASRTAAIIRAQGGLAEDAPAFFVDERLREREFGILDRLTRLGIEQLYPEQAEMRRTLGKFYHRPPGGESWCDVILRLRSALDTLSLHHSRRRVLIVTHEVVIMCFRYLLEELDEASILQIGETSDVANCGVTGYEYSCPAGRADGHLALRHFNFTAPIEDEGAPVTTAHDVASAAK